MRCVGFFRKDLPRRDGCSPLLRLWRGAQLWNLQHFGLSGDTILSSGGFRFACFGKATHNNLPKSFQKTNISNFGFTMRLLFTKRSRVWRSTFIFKTLSFCNPLTTRHTDIRTRRRHKRNPKKQKFCTLSCSGVVMHIGWSECFASLFARLQSDCGRDSESCGALTSPPLPHS